MAVQAKKAASSNRWPQEVTKHSNALDLEQGVFSRDIAKKNAASLKRSADRSRQRKSSPFQPAMSMLNFYINRAGKTLPENRRRRLANAKSELRRLYGE
jgi:uncharacterized protein YbgA (DUF1722 family)